MEIVKRIQRMKAAADEKRAAGLKIGFVPTMGALHEGHMSLVRRSQEMADVTVTSIFVNAYQFARGEDFEKYPRDILGDEDKLKQAGVDFLFYPEASSVYPPGYRTFVTVEGLSETLCGASRPGHFRGVATVVLKLLNIVRPHFLFLGRKDAQQTVLLQRMAKDLHLDVELVLCPVVREKDGLAMSSRNLYLSPKERKAAGCLYQALQEGRDLVLKGEREASAVAKAVSDAIAAEPLARIDYVAIVDPEDLTPRQAVEGATLLAIAVWIGQTRLIDNLTLDPDEERRS